MPAIPEFTVIEGRQAANTVKVTPSEEAIQTLQQGARNISRLTNERAQYTAQAGRDIGRGLGALGLGAEDVGKAFEQHQTLEEIKAMGPDFARLESNAYDQLHAAIAANDPAAVQKLRDNLENQFDDWQSKAVTRGAQAHAITQVDQLRNRILGVALPGEMAQAAYHSTVNSLGEMSSTYGGLAARRPEAIDGIIQSMGTQIDALVANHTLVPGSQEELKGLKQKAVGQVVGTGINAVIRGNPDEGMAPNPGAARQMIKKYSPYLTPAEQQHFLSEADAQDKAVEVQGRADEAETRRQQKEAANTALNGIVGRLIQPDGTFRVGPTTVHDLVSAAAMPGATPGEVKSAMEMVNQIVERQRAGKEIVSDPAALASLQARALSGELTPQELYQNAAKLSQKDISNTYTMMERINKSGSEFHNDNQLLKTTQNFGYGKIGVDPTLPATMGQHPEAIRFQIWFNAAAAKAQREGKLPEFAQQLANAPDTWWDSFKTAQAPNPGSGLAIPGPAPSPAGESVGTTISRWWHDFQWGGTR